jgi:hypothetical protein
VDATLGILVRWALVADLMLVFGMPLFALIQPLLCGHRSGLSALRR